MVAGIVPPSRSVGASLRLFRLASLKSPVPFRKRRQFLRLVQEASACEVAAVCGVIFFRTISRVSFVLAHLLETQSPQSVAGHVVKRNLGDEQWFDERAIALGPSGVDGILPVYF